MRTRLTTLALVLATLSACATSPRVHGVEPAGPPPLRVWIGFPIGSSRVHPIFTNREAYVAMFEIIPGRGATMVYPFHRGHAIASDAHYADLSLQRGRMFYHSDPFGHASYQPRYYYVVASVAPLNLTRLQSSLGAMRRVLGRTYGSYRPYDVIDRLTELVVPMQADEDWATDMFIDWPDFPMPMFASTRLMRCANGRVFEVPSNYPYYGCPGDAEPAVVASAAPTAAPTPPKKGTVDAPRVPRSGGGRDGLELSDPGVTGRRRAEPGAQTPRAGSVTRSPSGRVRYSDEQPASGHSPDRSGRGTSSAGSSSAGSSSAGSSYEPESAGRSSAGTSQSGERGEPASKPATERSGSGKEKKP